MERSHISAYEEISQRYSWRALTAVLIKSCISWDITVSISLKVNRCFKGTCRLHTQGWEQESSVTAGSLPPLSSSTAVNSNMEHEHRGVHFSYREGSGQQNNISDLWLNSRRCCPTDRSTLVFCPGLVPEEHLPGGLSVTPPLEWELSLSWDWLVLPM